MIVKTCGKDITQWERLWRNRFRRSHPLPEKSAAKIAKRYSRPAPYVVIADETLSDAEILALHEMGDCFVSLTRTEGWGLGAFEAARLGKPVVMTGYGGQLDFLAADHAWLVDYKMVPVHEPTWPSSYKPGDLWAEPSISQAAVHLRSIFADSATAKQRAQCLATRIKLDFGRKATVDALLSALQ
jgi:glycosyltransferase involved in cell wall biosynthesis